MEKHELKILEQFCLHPDAELYPAFIASKSKLNISSVSRKIISLSKQNILRYRLSGRMKLFGLNFDELNCKYKLIETEAARTQNFLDKHDHFKSFLKSVPVLTGCLVLFGSFSKGTETSESDVDLLLVSDQAAKLPQYLLKNDIHKINVSNNYFEESLIKKEPLMLEVLYNHIILQNPGRFVEMWWRAYAK